MKIRTSVFKIKSGKSAGRWVARLLYTDELGKARQMERQAETRGAANDIRDPLAADLAKSHGGDSNRR